MEDSNGLAFGRPWRGRLRDPSLGPGIKGPIMAWRVAAAGAVRSSKRTTHGIVARPLGRLTDVNQAVTKWAVSGSP